MNFSKHLFFEKKITKIKKWPWKWHFWVMTHKITFWQNLKGYLEPKFSAFRALALKLAKIQRWKEKGVIFQLSFKNPRIAKKALVKNIFFFISREQSGNAFSFSIDKSRVFLKKTWWQISSSVRYDVFWYRFDIPNNFHFDN